jgi:hypothetical protein
MKKVSEVSPRLYHYTTEQGLYGILDNQCLWATHYKFLNDSSEIILFRDKLIKFLSPSTLDYLKKLISNHPNTLACISDMGGMDTVVKSATEGIVDTLYKFLSHEIYITSFCGEHTTDDFINENGLLSQWRAYGGDGGFAVVFKKHELDEMLRSEYEAFYYDHFLLADMVYSDDEEKYQLELSKLLHKITPYLQESLKQLIEGRAAASNSAGEAFSSFVQCITRYKHQGFKEEQEFRVVAMPTPPDLVKELAEKDSSNLKLEKKREFRDRNGKRTPYIELFRSLKTELPIEKIIVGPHKDKDSRAAALRIMLRNTDIKVTVSEIPYQ